MTRSALPPGPSSPGIVQTLRSARDFEGYMARCGRRYGSVYTIRFVGLGNLVYLTDPADIKEVFTADPDLFRAGEANQMLEPVLGQNSVLLLDGERHLRRRRLLLPPFHGESIERYRELIGEITLREVGRWPLGRTFALRPRMQEITLEVILRAVFGISEAARLERLRVLLPELLTRSSALMWLPIMQRRFGRWSPARRFERVRDAIDELLYDEIGRRRESGPTGDDVLSILLGANDEDGRGLTDTELRDELMTAVTAGHETTATAMSWTFDLLLHHPAVLERLEASLAADDDTYLDAVVKESLRVRPVVADVGRVLSRPAAVAGYELPAGTMVVPAITAVHRYANRYPEPFEFRPERFLEGQPEPYTWIPFGGGTRRCVGAAFAQLEMKVAIPTILSAARLEPAADRPERSRLHNVTLVPPKGVRVRLVERRPAPGRDFAHQEAPAPAAGT
jgi:cytochrome P450